MPNIYVGQMKDIVKVFYRKNREYENQKQDNAMRYVADLRDEYNNEISKQQVNACNRAKQTIAEIYSDVRGKLGKCCFLDSERINSDRLLLESGIPLSRDEVQMLVDKNRGNYTMLRLIQNYVNKHNENTSEYPMGQYADIHISLPEDSVSVYARFAQSAIDLIDSIYTGTATEAMVEGYADENFSADLFSIIGDGMNLNSQISPAAPNSLEHHFDSVNLVMDTNANVFTA